MWFALPEKDHFLYGRFLDGDDSSFDALVLHYGDSLTVYLQAILHDWQDAEDMTVEAFARIMVKRPRIKEGAFKAYLFKTARNLAFRLSSRRRSDVFSLEGLTGDPSAGGYIEEHIAAEEQKQMLHLCLERIDPMLREALWLIYFEGMSYAQAAEVMKVNTKKIDHLLTRAKKKLREELLKEGISHVYE